MRLEFNDEEELIRKLRAQDIGPGLTLKRSGWIKCAFMQEGYSLGALINKIDPEAIIKKIDRNDSDGLIRTAYLSEYPQPICGTTMKLIDEEIANHVSFHLGDTRSVVANIEGLISLLKARIDASQLPKLLRRNHMRSIRQAELNHKDQVTISILFLIIEKLDIELCRSMAVVKTNEYLRV